MSSARWLPAPGWPAGLAALLLAAGQLAACSAWSEPGVRVEFVSRSGLGTGRQLLSALGVVRVEELSWTSSEIELRRCDGMLAVLERWLLPGAQAHGQSSPTLLAAPSVVSAALAETALGGLEPPAGRYCSVRYRVGPADADALGLSAMPEMLHHSLRLRAEFGPSATDLQRFELLSQRSFDVSLPIELELSAEHPSARLDLALDAERWLSGIDIGSLAGVAREDALMTLFRAALDVRVE